MEGKHDTMMAEARDRVRINQESGAEGNQRGKRCEKGSGYIVATSAIQCIHLSNIHTPTSSHPLHPFAPQRPQPSQGTHELKDLFGSSLWEVSIKGWFQEENKKFPGPTGGARGMVRDEEESKHNMTKS